VDRGIKWKPIHASCIYNYLDLSRILIQYGANVNIRTRVKGYTPLHLLVTNQKMRTNDHIKYLINRGGDINKRTESGATAMHLAVHYNEKDRIRLLVELGVDLFIKNGKGRTALGCAARFGFREIAEFLAQKMNVKCPRIANYAPHCAKAFPPLKVPSPADLGLEKPRGRRTQGKGGLGKEYNSRPKRVRELANHDSLNSGPEKHSRELSLSSIPLTNDSLKSKPSRGNLSISNGSQNNRIARVGSFPQPSHSAGSIGSEPDQSNHSRDKNDNSSHDNKKNSRSVSISPKRDNKKNSKSVSVSPKRDNKKNSKSVSVSPKRDNSSHNKKNSRSVSVSPKRDNKKNSKSVSVSPKRDNSSHNKKNRRSVSVSPKRDDSSHNKNNSRSVSVSPKRDNKKNNKAGSVSPKRDNNPDDETLSSFTHSSQLSRSSKQNEKKPSRQSSAIGSEDSRGGHKT